MGIPYGRQDINPKDIQAVINVLKSDFLTQGDQVPAFEQAVATQCESAYAVAVCNATAALHLACLALDLQPGDRVWTTPISFVASANCARYCGAEVDFVDIDPRSYNLSVEALRNKLKEAERQGQLPKIVIPVHLCGQPCEMEQIYALGQKYGFKIIEDASHAIGGRYQGRPIGNSQFSDITVFSFHPVKIITTGEGGMALTQNQKLFAKMQRLRTHGITRDSQEMEKVPDGPWYYEMTDMGFNYRMTDIQAALGHSQLSRLLEFIQRRHFLANRYNQQLAGWPIQTPWQHPDSYSGFHLYVIRLANRATRNAVFEHLREADIGVNLHYIPIYRQPYYARMGFQPDHFLEAEQYYAQALTLPLYPHLSEAAQDSVITCLKEALQV